MIQGIESIENLFSDLPQTEASSQDYKILIDLLDLAILVADPEDKESLIQRQRRLIEEAAQRFDFQSPFEDLTGKKATYINWVASTKQPITSQP